MSYSSSSVALGLPSMGLKSTTSSSLTANTESSTRYLLVLSKICVVRGVYLSFPACVAVSQAFPVVVLSRLATYNDMNMGGAVGMTIEKLQELSGRACHTH
jgi:hypothetical protein